MPSTFNFIVSESGKNAVDILAEQTGLSKQRIKDAMNKGACWWTLKGKQLRLRRATKPIDKGTRLQLYYDEQILAREAQANDLIYDAGRYSVWYKPHGVLAQGSQWGDHCSLLRWVEVTYKRECFLIHRLDADAAGLMILAHDAQAAAVLSNLFQERKIHKNYLAWVMGEWKKENPFRIDSPLDGKEAITIITDASYNAESNATLLTIDIETGRKHQIRRHLSSLGYPIAGDKLYNGILSGSYKEQPLLLLAQQLNFYCPIKKLTQDIKIPPDILEKFIGYKKPTSTEC